MKDLASLDFLDRAGDEACALIREALTASGDIIPARGTLTIRLDPLTAPRRTRAIAALCGRPDLPLAVNVGSGQATSVLEVVALVSEVMDSPIDILTGSPRPFDVQRVALDITRLQHLIDFAPMSLRDGIGLTWATMAADTVA